MEMINKAVEQFKPNAFKLAGITLLFMMASMMLGVIGAIIPGIGVIVQNVLFLICTVIYVRIYMQVVNNENDLNFNSCSESLWSTSWKLILLTIIKSVMLLIALIPIIILTFLSAVPIDNLSSDMSVGVIFMIVGIFVSIMLLLLVLELIFGFATYTIVDEDFINNSFKESLVDGVKMMKGYRLKYVVAQLIGGLLFLAGMLMFGIGTIFTTSLANLILINLYKEAKENYFGYNYRKDMDLDTEF